MISINSTATSSPFSSSTTHLTEPEEERKILWILQQRKQKLYFKWLCHNIQFNRWQVPIYSNYNSTRDLLQPVLLFLCIFWHGERSAINDRRQPPRQVLFEIKSIRTYVYSCVCLCSCETPSPRDLFPTSCKLWRRKPVVALLSRRIEPNSKLALPCKTLVIEDIDALSIFLSQSRSPLAICWGFLYLAKTDQQRHSSLEVTRCQQPPQCAATSQIEKNFTR